MKVRWIDLGKVGHLRSQCIYHGLAYAHNDTSPDTIVLAIPQEPYICVGHFQDPKRELDITYCKENNLPIIRRQTGGGAVYIDDNQLFVQWIFSPSSVSSKVSEKFEYFIRPMVETYRHFGIDAYGYKGHDVHVGGKKIVGTGAARIADAEVITGNFIRGFDCRHMVGALNLPGDLMRFEVSQGMDQYMTSFTAQLEAVPHFDEVKSVYRQKCSDILGMEIYEGSLTDNELKHIRDLEVKLSDEKWTYSMEHSEKNCRLIKIHAGLWIGHSSVMVNGKSMNLTLRLKEDKVDFLHLDLEGGMESGLGSRLETAFRNKNLDDEAIEKEIKHCFSSSYESEEISAQDFADALNTIRDEKRKISGGA